MNERMYYSREAEQRAQQQRTAMVALVLAMGLGIGALLALLFAPRPGESTRKILGQQVEHAYDNGREVTGTAFESLRKEVERLRSDVEDRVKQAQH
ncbi:MAG: YtxH domain-containing protein [Anaerolineae bacterium]